MMSPAYWSSLSPDEPASREINPWAALDDDSEDESDEVVVGASTPRSRKPSTQKSRHFQFQPATFLTQDRMSKMNVRHSSQSGYDDPDL